MSLTYRSLAAAVAAGFLMAVAAPPSAFAGVSQGQNRPAEVAIGGYDPVAYFETGTPTRGVDSLRIAHRGAVYLFSSEKNLQAFRADAEKYTPQYGGNCALGMRYGQKSRVDPKVWRIVDG